MNLTSRARLAIRQASEVLSQVEIQEFDYLIEREANKRGLPVPVSHSDLVKIVCHLIDVADSFQSLQRRNHRRTA